jgi:MFS family permease
LDPYSSYYKVWKLMMILQFARNIAATFGGVTETVWLAQIVAIIISATGPPIAQATDYWGRKWLLVTPTALGFAGSMIIARASSWGMVLGGQVIAALAFAPSSLVYAVGSEILPRKWRPAAQGGLNIATGLGSIFALLLGEHLVSHSADGWRTYFYINGGLVGLSALIFAIFYNPPPRQLQTTLTQRQKLAKVSNTTLATMDQDWRLTIFCFSSIGSEPDYSQLALYFSVWDYHGRRIHVRLWFNSTLRDLEG